MKYIVEDIDDSFIILDYNDMKVIKSNAIKN